MSASGKVIMCAITGSGHKPTMSPHLPYSIDAVVEQGIEAAEAGAAGIEFMLNVVGPETLRDSNAKPTTSRICTPSPTSSTEG